MNVISMVYVIDFVANPVIGEPALPDFLVAPDAGSEFVRVGALDQLNSPLDGYVVRRSQQEMNMFGHDDESVQGIAPFATMPIECFQEETHVDFDLEQLSGVKSTKSHEVSSGRGEESSRLQSEPSAAKSHTCSSTLNWHEWNVPFPVVFLMTCFVSGKEV